MITLKDLEEARSRGADTVYAVFPTPQGMLVSTKQSLASVKEALEDSLKQSAKLPDWAERRFLTRDEAEQYIKALENRND